MKEPHKVKFVTDTSGNPIGLELPGLFSFFKSETPKASIAQTKEPKTETKPVQNERFAGFAELLFNDLDETDGVHIDTFREDWEEEWKQIIARRASDLVSHVLAEQIAIGNIEQGSLENVIESVSDMTAWPEEAQ